MVKSKKKPSSFFVYMIKVMATGLAAILAGGLFVLILTNNFLVEDNFQDGPDLKQLSKDIASIEGNDYSSIDASSLGKDGYFEILDSSCHVIYSQRDHDVKEYKPYIIKYIPEIDHSIFIDFSSFIDNHETYYLLKVQDYRALDSKEKNMVKIFKEDGTMIFSSDNGDGENISSEEFDYIMKHADRPFGRYYGKKMIIEKKIFKDPHSGEKRIMLFHFKSRYQLYQKKAKELEKIRTFVVVIFVLYVILVIFTALFFFYRKIKKPINALQMALYEVSFGKEVEVDSNVGTKEISQVLDAFNSMEKRLKAMNSDREKAREERNTALSDISHDLKTPITVISGYAEAMRDGIIPMEDSKKYLDIICQKAKTMSELITQFSDYSRFENPEFKICREKGDLAEYLRAYIASRFNELTLAGYNIDTDIPESPVMFDFDRSQLKRVFENIITNSVKYTKDTTIFASIKEEGNNIIIELGDDGPGVSSKIKENIFEPFLVGDDSRKSGKGTGLGLSIARKIVEAHGGRIELEDREKGLYYRITFSK